VRGGKKGEEETRGVANLYLLFSQGVEKRGKEKARASPLLRIWEKQVKRKEGRFPNVRKKKKKGAGVPNYYYPGQRKGEGENPHLIHYQKRERKKEKEKTQIYSFVDVGEKGGEGRENAAIQRRKKRGEKKMLPQGTQLLPHTEKKKKPAAPRLWGKKKEEERVPALFLKQGGIHPLPCKPWEKKEKGKKKRKKLITAGLWGGKEGKGENALMHHFAAGGGGGGGGSQFFSLFLFWEGGGKRKKRFPIPPLPLSRRKKKRNEGKKCPLSFLFFPGEKGGGKKTRGKGGGLSAYFSDREGKKRIVFGLDETCCR